MLLDLEILLCPSPTIVARMEETGYSVTDSDLSSFDNSHLQWNKQDANGTLQQSSNPIKSCIFCKIFSKMSKVFAVAIYCQIMLLDKVSITENNSLTCLFVPCQVHTNLVKYYCYLRVPEDCRQWRCRAAVVAVDVLITTVICTHAQVSPEN